MLKRSFDVTVALLATVLLAPVLVVVGLAIALLIGRPIFFRQERPGLNGKVFSLIKFRTMSEARDANGDLLPDDERLSGFGRFIRASSLDELPQLLNVIRGEMSFVGPRPLLVEYLDIYSPTQFRRHEVLPGITGWAQVSGRNAITWEQKFALDVWYVDHRSFLLDIKILYLTIVKVLKRSDIDAAGKVGQEKFRG